MNQILLELETHKAGIDQDLAKHRHYYKLTNCKLECEIDELGFYQSLRDESSSL